MKDGDQNKWKGKKAIQREIYEGRRKLKTELIFSAIREKYCLCET